jgi:hypothetical protein
MLDQETLLLEDLTIPTLTFPEYRKICESFHNFLPSDVEKKKAHADELFGLVQKSYADQGGIKGSGFNSPDDMVKNIPMWKLSKKDGKINAAGLYKDSSGRKRVATSTDGSDAGRKAAADIVVNDLKQNRSHQEVSGKSLSFLKKLMPIKDHLHSYESAEKFHASRGDTISKPADDDKEVLRHPELKEHMYSRVIGGHTHTKVMIGTMGNKITEATVYDKAVEQENGKDSPLSPEPFKKGEWTFNPKGHAPSQAKERRPDWKPEYWHQLHDKVHAVLTDHKKQVSPKGAYPKPVKSGEALFYSGKQKQGYFANVDHAKKEIRLITVLPAGQSRVTKPTDQKIVLDHVEILEDTQIFYLD